MAGSLEQVARTATCGHAASAAPTDPETVTPSGGPSRISPRSHPVFWGSISAAPTSAPALRARRHCPDILPRTPRQHDQIRALPFLYRPEIVTVPQDLRSPPRRPHERFH